MGKLKLGLLLGYSGRKLELPMERIKLAERLGFDSVWTAEAYGSDALTPLAFIAAHTSKIRLGTQVMQMAGRSPAMAAMQVGTLDVLSGGGRVIAGLGMSGPQVVEGWYGMPWGKPYHWTKDYIGIMRKIFRREGPVTHDGEQWSLPLPASVPGASGEGKPLQSILYMNPDIPIWSGSNTDLMVKLTAEIADGWIPLGWSPDGMSYYRDLLQAGFAKAGHGKGFHNFEIQARVAVIIQDDVPKALATLKKNAALYVGGMGMKGKNFHKDRMSRLGFKEAAEHIQELYLAGRKQEAEAAVPDEYIDDQNLVGPAARIARRFRAWEDSGCTGLTVNVSEDEAVELMARVASAEPIRSLGSA
jgi:F420-dependent oxidoreductase-like protein